MELTCQFGATLRDRTGHYAKQLFSGRQHSSGQGVCSQLRPNSVNGPSGYFSPGQNSSGHVPVKLFPFKYNVPAGVKVWMRRPIKYDKSRMVRNQFRTNAYNTACTYRGFHY
jgi:hypothetical protein